MPVADSVEGRTSHTPPTANSTATASSAHAGSRESRQALGSRSPPSERGRHGGETPKRGTLHRQLRRGVGRARPAPTLLGLDESRVYLRGHRPTGQSAHTERRDLLVPRGRRALGSGRDSREEGKRDPRPSDMERPVNPFRYLRVTSKSGHVMSVAIERLLRRLITLIYAGRDRMVVIRRELPRTKRAGPARRPAA